jgi:PAS domain S-box-containing protein
MADWLFRWGFAALLVLVCATVCDAAIRQVLVLQSFDRGNIVLDRINLGFRAEIDRRSIDPITFIEFVVTPAGSDTTPDAAVVDFLQAAFAGRARPDLVITFGGPAAAFARRNRPQLFPEVPLLFAAVDQRFVNTSALAGNETVAAVANNPAGYIEDILQIVPETANLFMIIGAGELGKVWRQQFEQASAGFRDRVRFIWPDGMSYAEILQRVSTLPPRSAILFSSFDLDSYGGTFSSERVLADIHARANAPLYATQGAELGYGAIGGNLMSADEITHATADAAFRILQGTPPSSIRIPVQQPGPPVYDWRELQRWGVPEDRLPPGSEIRYRVPSTWERFRWVIVASASALLLQSLLISALLVNRAKRRRAEQSLRESEGRFRVFANSAPVMIRMSDPDGVSTDFNVPWLEFTGRTLEQELGNGWSDGIHPEDAAAAQARQRAIERRVPYRIEYRLRRFDGEYRWVLDSGQPRFTPDGSLAGFIDSAIDITDLKAARATMSNLNRRLLQAQEQERSRLARELHDDVCQRMSILAVDLAQLAERAADNVSDISQRLQDLHRDAAELGFDVSGISHRLHSSKLNVLGLAEASATLCREMSTHHGVSIEFAHQNVPQQLREGLAINLFRVLQEALSNAVKHSGASSVRVSLRRIDDTLRLEIVDSGRGFDAAAAIATSGLGLVSMQERLRLVNGEAIVESAPGAGTTVRATVALTTKSAAGTGITDAGAWT